MMPSRSILLAIFTFLAVCTGASHNSVNSASSLSTEIDAPCISREVV